MELAVFLGGNPRLWFLDLQKKPLKYTQLSEHTPKPETFAPVGMKGILSYLDFGIFEVSSCDLLDFFFESRLPETNMEPENEAFQYEFPLIVHFSGSMFIFRGVASLKCCKTFEHMMNDMIYFYPAGVMGSWLFHCCFICLR